VTLYTNQYRLTLGENITAYQYEIEILPGETETYLFNKIVNSASKNLNMSFGFYILAGKTIFTP
jgi:hypothetical protein